MSPRRTTVQMESELLRNSLLAAISHDLRTPLSVLVGLAESMAMTVPPPTAEQRKITDAMREESLRMNSLVNNLLDMARLQAGQVKLNRQWQPIEEVIGSSLGASQSQLADRNISTQLAPDLPLVEFDAVLIERVLCNLLENAAKYTPSGSHIEIGAELKSISGDRKVLSVWVADDGPGLPPGKEDEIFEKFARGQKESATPGVGLGLAICRAIVEAHGGTIRGENRSSKKLGDIEHGARFSFTLPCGLPPEISRIHHRRMSTLAPTLIVVEDEERIRHFIRLALESEGYQVHEADSIQRGLIEAGTRKPDMVVLDLGLPDGDGSDFVRQLRSWSGIPVLVLVGS